MSDNALQKGTYPNNIFVDLDSLGLEEVTVEKTHHVKDKKVIVLKIIVLVLCILLLIEAFLYAVIIPCMAPSKFEFKGLDNLTQAELIEKLGDLTSVSWLKFDTEKAVEAFSSVSSIETVCVEKHFPDKVIIQIKERVPVAKTIIIKDDKSVPIQIDKNGVLFTGTVSSNYDNNIPLITGLPVNDINDGMRLSAKYRNLMEQISDLRNLPQKYFAAISEIQVVNKDYGNYELILYPIHTRIRVLTDRTLDEDALKYMMVVLDVVNSIEPEVTEIDLRYGAVSYRTR